MAPDKNRAQTSAESFQRSEEGRKERAQRSQGRRQGPETKRIQIAETTQTGSRLEILGGSRRKEGDWRAPPRNATAILQFCRTLKAVLKCPQFTFTPDLVAGWAAIKRTIEVRTKIPAFGDRPCLTSLA